MSSTTAASREEPAARTAYHIVEATSADLRAEAGNVQVALKAAFDGADFMPGFGPESPWAHTAGVLDGPASGDFRHVLGMDAGGAIVGAVLCVPTERRGEQPADPGWFFVSPEVPRAERVRLADALVEAAHRLARDGGFERAVTKMGTRSGALYLMRRHGYRKEPAGGEDNRYVREL